MKDLEFIEGCTNEQRCVLADILKRDDWRRHIGTYRTVSAEEIYKLLQKRSSTIFTSIKTYKEILLKVAAECNVPKCSANMSVIDLENEFLINFTEQAWRSLSDEDKSFLLENTEFSDNDNKEDFAFIREIFCANKRESIKWVRFFYDKLSMPQHIAIAVMPPVLFPPLAYAVAQGIKKTLSINYEVLYYACWCIALLRRIEQ